VYGQRLWRAALASGFGDQIGESVTSCRRGSGARTIQVSDSCAAASAAAGADALTISLTLDTGDQPGKIAGTN
jgi:hypothetical protein